MQAFEQAQRNVVRACEHGGGIGREHCLRGLVCARDVILALKLQARVDGKDHLAQRALVAGEALTARVGSARVNETGNATMALLNQIARSHIAAHLVIEHHLVALESFNGTVDHYGRDGKMADFFAQGTVIGKLIAYD